MRYRIKVDKTVRGYDWQAFEIKGDFEVPAGEGEQYYTWKWTAILGAKLWIKRRERRRNYPIEVANIEYETKNQAT